MREQGKPLADIPRIPEGLHEGAWIKPGCTAIEASFTDVTFWEDTWGKSPGWMPHPFAQELRAKKDEKAHTP